MIIVVEGRWRRDIFCNRGIAISLLQRAHWINCRGVAEGWFCETMAAAGASFTEEDVFVSSVKDEFKAGVELAQQVLHTGKMYTAISANNDAVALGILSELAKCGLKVPEDISVIGFDDCVFSRMSIPLLTTVQVPAEEMGKMAAQFMLNELEIKKTQYSIYLEPKIVERQSVRKIETRGETVV